MKRMDAGGYAACFNHEQLALMCANSDRTIDRLGAENKQLKTENKELRKELSEAFQMMHRGGLTTGAYGRCMELFRDAQALGIEIPFMNELEAEVNE